MAHPEEGNQIYWHKPKKRGIIPLNQFHAGRNLMKLYSRGIFKFTLDEDFEGVLRGCSNRETTWISEEIIQSYVQLHQMGIARSVEVWKDDTLVGGLYGIQMKRAFFGESMFSVVSNASKLALVYLVEFMKQNDLILLDTQYLNDHLKQFGAIEISDKRYMKLLEEALGS